MPGELEGGANPHGAAMGGGSPHAAGGEAAITIEGTVEPSPALRGEVKAGDTIYLVAKEIDPATGEPGKLPIGIDRLEAGAGAVSFSLSVTASGTAAEVLVTARVDRDGEARSRNPGDVEGSVKTKLPAGGVKLILDKKVE